MKRIDLAAKSWSQALLALSQIGKPSFGHVLGKREPSHRETLFGGVTREHLSLKLGILVSRV